MEGLKASLEQTSQPRNQEDREILDLSQKCLETAILLRHELSRLRPGSNRNAIGTILRVARKRQWIHDTNKKLKHSSPFWTLDY